MVPGSGFGNSSEESSVFFLRALRCEFRLSRERDGKENKEFYALKWCLLLASIAARIEPAGTQASRKSALQVPVQLVFRNNTTTSPELSIVLLDWSCRES